MKLGCVGSSQHRHKPFCQFEAPCEDHKSPCRAGETRRPLGFPKKGSARRPITCSLVVYFYLAVPSTTPTPTLRLPCPLARATPACQLSCHLSSATAIHHLSSAIVQSILGSLSAVLLRHDGFCHAHNGRAPCSHGHALGGSSSMSLLARTRGIQFPRLTEKSSRRIAPYHLTRVIFGETCKAQPLPPVADSPRQNGMKAASLASGRLCLLPFSTRQDSWEGLWGLVSQGAAIPAVKT